MPGRSTFTATGLRPSGGVDLGAMHLRDRGRRDRRAERCEQLRPAACRAPPSTTASASRLRERRHLVLQAFEIARERDADHVGPRRQELAELDVGRAEPRQRGGEPALRRRRWSAARSAARAAARAAPAQRQRRADRPARTRPRARTRSRRGRGGRDGRGRRSCTMSQAERSAAASRNACADARRRSARAMTTTRREARRLARIISANAAGSGNLRIDSTR